MTSPAPGHRVSVVHKTVDGGRVTRAVCQSCPWRSRWMSSASRAVEASLVHSADAARLADLPVPA